MNPLYEKRERALKATQKLMDSGDIKTNEEALEFYHAIMNKKSRAPKTISPIGRTTNEIINRMKKEQ